MNTTAHRKQKLVLIATFLLIPVLLLGTFTYYPAVRLLQLSFSSWDGINPTIHYVGWDNYRDIFKNRDNLDALWHNTAYLIVGLLQMALALYFAIVLSGKIRGRKAFRSILFLPYMLNSVAISFMFQYVLSYDDGALNQSLRHLGLGVLAMKWLSDPHIVNFTFGFMNLWKYMGFMMVIFLGALQSIPQDIYEAAEIDGANAWQKFRRITLPNIRKIVELCLFLNLNGALASFEFPFSVYPLGSPFGIADTVVMRTLNTAFKFSSYGLASAMGIVLMLIVAVLVMLQRKLVVRRED